MIYASFLVMRSAATWLVLVASVGNAACSVVLPTDDFTGSTQGASGNHEVTWTRPLGDSADQDLFALAVSSSGEVALGGRFGGPLNNSLTLIAADGEPQWGLAFGNHYQHYTKCVAFAGSESLYVAGSFQNSILVGDANLTAAGDEDIFVARFASADGGHEWSKPIGGPGAEIPLGLAVSPDAQPALTGDLKHWSGAETDFGVGPFSSADWSSAYVVILSEPPWGAFLSNAGIQTGKHLDFEQDGNLYAVGMTDGGTLDVGGGTFSASLRSSYIFKFAADDRRLLWSAQFGEPYENFEIDVASDGPVVAGSFPENMKLDFGHGLVESTGGDDVFVAKIDPENGRFVWGSAFGGPGNQGFQAMAVTPNGHIWVGGSFDGTATFVGDPLVATGDADAFLVELDENGVPIWTARWSGTGIESVRGVGIDAAGNVVAAGVFDSDIDFGNGTMLTSEGSTDVFVVRLTR